MESSHEENTFHYLTVAIAASGLLSAPSQADGIRARPSNPTPVVTKQLVDQPKTSSTNPASTVQSPGSTGQSGGKQSAPFEPVTIKFSKR